MASVNAWADGMSAFKDAYGMVRGFQKTNRTKKIMDDEKFMAEGGAGYGLEGSALEKARYRALGDLETEFGNAEGGLANRRMVQQIEQGDRDNRINEANEAYRTRLEGEIAEQTALLKNLNIKSDTTLKGSQSYAARGQGRLSFGRANELSTLLPGKKLQQAADLSYTKARTDQSVAGAELTREQAKDIQNMRPDELKLLQAQTGLTNEKIEEIKKMTPERVNALKASTAQTDQETLRAKMMMPLDVARGVQTNLGLSLGNQEKAATLEGTVDATNAKSALQAATDTAALDAQRATRGHLETVVAADYGTAEEADAALLKLIQGDASIPRAQQMAFETAISNHGLQNLTTQSAEITKTAELKIKEGGLEAGMAYYDEIDDGVTLSLTDPDEQGNVQMIATQASDDPNSDGRERVLFQGSREQVQQQLLTQLSDPMKMMEVTAGYLDMQVKRSNIDNTDSTIALRDEQIKLVQSQTDKVREEIASSKASMPEQKKIAWKGLGEMMGDADFGLLEPEERRSMQFEYMKTMGMLTENKDGSKVIAVHPGFTGTEDEWNALTPEGIPFSEAFLLMEPEDQALFLKGAGQNPPTADTGAGLTANRAPNRNIPSMSASEVAQAKSLNSKIAPPGVRQAEWTNADRNRKLTLLKNAGGGLSANSTRPSNTANDADVDNSILPPGQRPSMPITVDSVTAPPGVKQAEWRNADRNRKRKLLRDAKKSAAK
jgi:hypothetical protein